MDLGQKVKQRREVLGWSQEELATRMGYKSRTSINKIENGRPVTQKIIKRLAEVLDVPISFLMGWDNEKGSIDENNTLIAAVVVRMRTDRDFNKAVEILYKMDAEKVAGVSAMLAAFEK